jgi:hypothetical protein
MQRLVRQSLLAYRHRGVHRLSCGIVRDPLPLLASKGEHLVVRGGQLVQGACNIMAVSGAWWPIPARGRS